MSELRRSDLAQRFDRPEPGIRRRRWLSGAAAFVFAMALTASGARAWDWGSGPYGAAWPSRYEHAPRYEFGARDYDRARWEVERELSSFLSRVRAAEAALGYAGWPPWHGRTGPWWPGWQPLTWRIGPGWIGPWWPGLWRADPRWPGRREPVRGRHSLERWYWRPVPNHMSTDDAETRQSP